MNHKSSLINRKEALRLFDPVRFSAAQKAVAQSFAKAEAEFRRVERSVRELESCEIAKMFYLFTIYDSLFTVHCPFLTAFTPSLQVGFPPSLVTVRCAMFHPVQSVPCRPKPFHPCTSAVERNDSYCDCRPPTVPGGRSRGPRFRLWKLRCCEVTRVAKFWNCPLSTVPAVSHRLTPSHTVSHRLTPSHVARARSETRRPCSLARAGNVWSDQRKKSGPSRSFDKLDRPMSWQKSEIR